MLKPFIVGTLLFALLPAAVPAVQASSFSLNTPGLSINIGDRDRRGYDWDGGRWRDRGWWENRSRHSPPPPPRYYGRPHYDNGHNGHDRDRGRGRGPDREHDRYDDHRGDRDHRR